MPDVSVNGFKTLSLRDLQSLLSKSFSDPRGPRNFEADQLVQLAQVISNDNLEDLFERCGIYADAYFLRLKEIVENDFPVTKKYLGDEKFLNLVIAYFSKHQPQNPNATWVGSRLPRFSAALPIDQERVYLTSFLTLEWLVIECIFSRYTLASPFVLDAQKTDFENLKFLMDSSLHFVHEKANIEDFWLACEDEDFNPSNFIFKTLEQKPWLGVRRLKANRIGFYRMSALEKEVYEILKRGNSLGEVCLIHAENPELPSLFENLSEWVEKEIIKSVLDNSSGGQKS